MKRMFTTVSNWCVVSVFAATLTVTPALHSVSWANDTAAALGAGGITFEKSADVQMKSENLYISESEVRVDYRFQNTSDKDVTTVVAFPFPKIPNGDIPIPELTGPFPSNYVSFTVTVNGKDVPTDVMYKAVLDKTGEDVGPRLKALGLPLDPQAYWALKTQQFPESTFVAAMAEGLLEGGEYNPRWHARDFDDPSSPPVLYQSKSSIAPLLDAVGLPHDAYTVTQDQILALPESTRKDLLDKKVLERQFYPTWEFQAVRYWTQTFPANALVDVQHRYKPIIGSTAGSPLDVACADTYVDAQEPREPEFCVDDSFMKTLAPSRSPKTRCVWPHPNWDPAKDGTVGYLDYILTTGANWSGPIQDFNLTIDKGSAKNLVSLCWKGDLKKVSPTQFQYSAKNFIPSQDLKLLLIKR